jgi:transposase-like protein
VSEEYKTAFLGLPKRNDPCGRCGWVYEGFHICFDASKPEPGRQQVESPGGNAPTKSSTKVSKRTSAPRRYGAVRARRRDVSKDPHIIKAYKEGLGMRDIAKTFRVGYQTVKNIISAEEKRTGEKIMRPRGSASPSTTTARKEETKERDQQIVSLYKEGLSIKRVGERVGDRPPNRRQRDPANRRGNWREHHASGAHDSSMDTRGGGGWACVVSRRRSK